MGIIIDANTDINTETGYVTQVAMVGQEPVLFSGSVKDNITYGLGKCDLQRVQDAARKANAHCLISQLENGYDTGTLQGKKYNTDIVQM